MELKVEGIIKHETTQPYKVELTRSQKGTYGWTITYHGELPDDTITNIEYIDAALRKDYISAAPVTEET